MTNSHHVLIGVCFATHSCWTFPAHSLGPCMQVTPKSGSDPLRLLRRGWPISPDESEKRLYWYIRSNICERKVDLFGDSWDNVIEQCFAKESIGTTGHDTQSNRNPTGS